MAISTYVYEQNNILVVCSVNVINSRNEDKAGKQ